MNRHVIVIGAGILGSMIATRLLNAASNLKVTVIDASLAGSGATLYSAGVHFPVGRTDRVKALGEMGSRYYSSLCAREPSLPIFPFEMQVVAPPERVAEVTERCVGLQPLSAVGIGGSLVWRLPGCHVSDVQHVAEWHLARLRSCATVLEGMRVSAIDERANEVRARLSDGTVVRGDILVLAPGPWVSEVPTAIYTGALGIRTKKVVALHVNLPPDSGTPRYFPIDDAFLAPLPHRGHWLFSYTCQQWDVSPDALRCASVGATEMEEAQHLARRIAPDIEPHIASGRVFCDAYSADREPVVRPVGTHGRVIFAGACNGSGYRLAPGIAHEVSELLGLFYPN